MRRTISVLGSWGKTMREAVRNKERWKGRRASAQDPSTDHLLSRTDPLDPDLWLLCDYQRDRARHDKYESESNQSQIKLMKQGQAQENILVVTQESNQSPKHFVLVLTNDSTGSRCFYFQGYEFERTQVNQI